MWLHTYFNEIRLFTAVSSIKYRINYIHRILKCNADKSFISIISNPFLFVYIGKTLTNSGKMLCYNGWKMHVIF